MFSPTEEHTPSRAYSSSNFPSTTSFGCAVDAISEALAFAPAGVQFGCALDAIKFALSDDGIDAQLDTYQRELRHSLCGSVWIEESQKPYLKPRLLAPLDDFVMQYISNEWKLKQPSVIISVTGGAVDFVADMGSTEEEQVRRDKALQRLLKRGLVRGAQSRGGAWLVTGGFDGGCMRKVGDATRQLSERFGGMGVVTIGICTFGRINNNELFMYAEAPEGRVYNIDAPPQPGKVWLNPDHSHYIFVGDEFSDWGAEIQFRSELEARYHAAGVPVIMVVMNGGIGTVNTVHRAVKDGFDIIVVKGSGRAADLIAYGMECKSRQSILDASAIAEEWKLKTKILLWKPGEDEFYARKLKDILVGGRITVYDLDEGNAEMIEEYIVTAQKKNKTHTTMMFKGVDSLMQMSGTILGQIEIPSKAHTSWLHAQYAIKMVASVSDSNRRADAKGIQQQQLLQQQQLQQLDNIEEGKSDTASSRGRASPIPASPMGGGGGVGGGGTPPNAFASTLVSSAPLEAAINALQQPAKAIPTIPKLEDKRRPSPRLLRPLPALPGLVPGSSVVPSAPPTREYIVTSSSSGLPASQASTAVADDPPAPPPSPPKLDIADNFVSSNGTFNVSSSSRFADLMKNGSTRPRYTNIGSGIPRLGSPSSPGPSPPPQQQQPHTNNDQLFIAEFFRPPKISISAEDAIGVMLVKWGLQIPKIALSIVGGIPNDSKDSRESKLVSSIFASVGSVADIADGWVITSARAKSAASFVDSKTSGSAPVIGFCSLKQIHGRDSIVEAKMGGRVKIQGVPPAGLDALALTHTHFVLCGDKDNDSLVQLDESRFGNPEYATRRKLRMRGRESDPGQLLRAKIEEYLLRIHRTAIVFVICNGSIATLSSALRATRMGVPVLVLRGTGGASSMLVEVHELYKRQHLQERTRWMLEMELVVDKYFPSLRGQRETKLEIVEECLEIIEDGKLYIVDINQANAAQRVKHILLRIVVERGTAGVTDNLGETSLMFAARCGDEALAMRMLEEGDILTTPDEQSLLLALKYGRQSIAMAIMNCIADTAHFKGKRPTYHQIFAARDADGNTPLMWAAYYDYVEIMQSMDDTVYYTAEFEASQKTMTSPTRRESFVHSNSSVNIGNDTMDLNSRNKYGHSALHFAVRGGSVRSVQWLLQHGANPLLPTPTATELIMSGKRTRKLERDRLQFLGADPDEYYDQSEMEEVQKMEEVRFNRVQSILRVQQFPFPSSPKNITLATEKSLLASPRQAQNQLLRIQSSVPSLRIPSPSSNSSSNSTNHPSSPGVGGALSPTEFATSLMFPDVSKLVDRNNEEEDGKYYSPYDLAMLTLKHHELRAEQLQQKKAILMKRFEAKQLQQANIRTGWRHGSAQVHPMIHSNSGITGGAGGGGGGGGTQAISSEAETELETAMVGQPLMRDMIGAFISMNEQDGFGKQVRLNRNLFALKKFFQWGGMYSVYIILVCVSAVMMTTGMSTDPYLLFSQVGSSVANTAAGNTCAWQFSDIAVASDFWLWTSSFLMPMLLSPATAPVYANSNFAEPMYSQNFVVGKIRFRQVRVSLTGCKLMPNAQACFPTFSPSTESRDTFGPGPEFAWQENPVSKLGSAYGAYFEYPAHGFVVELSPYDIGTSNDTLNRLQSNGWIDAATRNVFVDICMLNVALEKVIVLQLSLEFLATGGVVPQSRISVLPRLESVDYALRILQLVLLIINFYSFMVEVSDFRESLWHSGGNVFKAIWAYVHGGFNLWDLCTIFLFCICAVLELVVHDEVVTQFGNGYALDQFYDVSNAIYYHSLQRDILAVYVLIVSFKILKYLQLVPRLGPALQAIFFTIGDTVIFAFICFILVFILVFCVSFHLAFGQNVYKFHTLGKSWFSVMHIIFGDIDSSFIDEYRGYAGPAFEGGVAGIFFMCIVLSGNLIVMNITIAVLGKAYENALLQHSSQAWQQMLTSLQAEDLWSTLPSRIKKTKFVDHIKDWFSGDRDKKFPRFVTLLPVRAINAWKEDKKSQEIKGQAMLSALYDEVGQMRDALSADLAAISKSVSQLQESANKVASSKVKKTPMNVSMQFHRKQPNAVLSPEIASFEPRKRRNTISLRLTRTQSEELLKKDVDSEILN